MSHKDDVQATIKHVQTHNPGAEVRATLHRWEGVDKYDNPLAHKGTIVEAWRDGLKVDARLVKGKTS